MIARQSEPRERLVAASPVGKLRSHQLAAKLAVMAGLYIATYHFFSVEGVSGGETRSFSVDITESCMRGTYHPPVFEVREGDRIVLTVTSLYAGALYIHGMERELNLTPGSEARITFTAEYAGRYYLHLHGDDEDHDHAEVAVLDVGPRS
jgi:hypothetical protein